jgi:hypothetical protein
MPEAQFTRVVDRNPGYQSINIRVMKWNLEYHSINIRVVKRNPGLDPINILRVYLVIYAWIR